eukprot:symbB.v1.2.035369.t1/scaffold4745.1/size37077/1
MSEMMSLDSSDGSNASEDPVYPSITAIAIQPPTVRIAEAPDELPPVMEESEEEEEDVEMVEMPKRAFPAKPGMPLFGALHQKTEAFQNFAEEITNILKIQHAEVMQRFDQHDLLMKDLKEAQSPINRRPSIRPKKDKAVKMQIPKGMDLHKKPTFTPKLFSSLTQADMKLKAGAADVDAEAAKAKKDAMQERTQSLHPQRSFLYRFTHSPGFDLFFALAILVNTVFIGVEVQISVISSQEDTLDWGFTVVLDVYNPHYYKPESPIWVAESDTEEAQRPKPKLLESRPKTKARATSSRATAEEVEEIEEEEEVVTTSVRTFPKIVKVPSQKEKPSHILPDLVVLYEKDDQGNFVQTRDTRFFAGYRSYYSTEQNIQLQAKGKGFHESIRLAVFLDYHQVLDRSYSESAWSSGALPKDSVTFLRKVKESAERVFGNKDSVFVAVLSHIESSSKNETSLLQNINNSPVGSEDLVQIILITRQRVGALGKAKTIEAVTQGHRIPSVIVDDNHQVIQECSDQRIHTAHIKLRRKPAVEDAEVVKNFLLETAEPIERLFGRYR